MLKATKIEEKIRLARRRLLKMHFDAGVGHIGGNLSALDALMVLYHLVLRPEDRFILSKGHAAGALYVVLWSLGKLSNSDLDSFHRENTVLPGHPPADGIDDISFATGSLGHGVSLATGTALAARLQAKERRVYCMSSDGEWEEGACWEALMLATHHHLNNLTIMIDCNGLQGFGTTTEVASLEPLGPKISSFASSVVEIDGHDPESVRLALEGPISRSPRVILLRTHKGHGVSSMRDKLESHYLPLTESQYEQAIAALEQAGHK